MEHAVEEVCVEVVAHCSQYNWLAGVWRFVKEGQGLASRAASMTALEFEVPVQVQVHAYLHTDYHSTSY